MIQTNLIASEAAGGPISTSIPFSSYPLVMLYQVLLPGLALPWQLLLALPWQLLWQVLPPGSALPLLLPLRPCKTPLLSFCEGSKLSVRVRAGRAGQWPA